MTAAAPHDDAALRRRGWGVVLALSLGYIGVYLARKNLAVAVPLLQADLGATREEVGVVASVGTVAYALGKLLNGPVVDRLGGRVGFLGALGVVTLFGGAGAVAPGLGALSLLYALNRFAGAAGWGAMVKIVPTWFGAARAATVLGVLSLSYVLGGVAATLFARQVVAWGGGWRAVMGAPVVPLLALLLVAWLTVREGPRVVGAGSTHGVTRGDAVPLDTPASSEAAMSDGDAPETPRETLRALFAQRVFVVACAVSFAVTLLREAFNTWSVDFLTLAAGGQSVAKAALGSIGFDLAGGVAILVNGWLYDRLPRGKRRWLMAGNLALLAGALLALPVAGRSSVAAATALLGAVGLLVYGPFSLLSGVIAVETGGTRRAATAAGVIDGVGYLASVLAGVTFGGLVDRGGYGLAFGVLAGITAVAAVVSLGIEGPATRPQAGSPE